MGEPIHCCRSVAGSVNRTLNDPAYTCLRGAGAQRAQESTFRAEATGTGLDPASRSAIASSKSDQQPLRRLSAGRNHAMDLLEPTTAAALSAALSLLVAALWLRRRYVMSHAIEANESLDTVQAWPPQAVRVMTLGERQAFEILRRALPGHVVLAQVPLSRFISVPTRFPYAQWLQRAGRLGVDLLVCDFSSRAVAAVEVRTHDESARSARRHQRLVEVLRAAGVKVHEWNEDDLPSVADARDLFYPKAGPAAGAEVAMTRAGRPLIPVAEIQEMLADGDATDYGQLEPVPSGFFEDEEPRLKQRAA
jgi:hypothetical protein